MGEGLGRRHTGSSAHRRSSELELQEVFGGGRRFRWRMAAENKVGGSFTDPKELLSALQVGVGPLVQQVAVVTEELRIP